MSGMDMLHNQRDKRRKVGNEMPPPMHPARSTPVTLPAAPAADPAPTESQAGPSPAAPASLPAPPPTTTVAPKRPAPPARQQDKRPAERVKNSELIPTTAYLELEEDRYIRRTIDAGQYGKPKVTSASAVIRYAVQYLAQHMTPDEVVAAIREAAPETSNQGRLRL